jgi:hypothetical protein
MGVSESRIGNSQGHGSFLFPEKKLADTRWPAFPPSAAERKAKEKKFPARWRVAGRRFRSWKSPQIPFQPLFSNGEKSAAIIRRLKKELLPWKGKAGEGF